MTTTDPDGVLHVMLNRFLMSLGSTLSQATLYETANRLLEEPIARLEGQLRELFTEGTEVTFQGRDESIFVNGRRLRCDGAAFMRHQQLLGVLAARGSSGMTFRGPLTANQWRTLLAVTARLDRHHSSPLEALKAAVVSLGLEGVVDFLPPVAGLAAPREQAPRQAPPGGGSPSTGGGSASTLRAPRAKIERRVFAVRTYAKAMVILREYLRHLEDPAARGYYQVRLQRLAQDLIAVAEDGGWKWIGLVNNKHYDDYLINHSVNVALLSLMTGLRVGFKRPRLAELSLAAMLHDVGVDKIPAEVVNKQGALTDDEKKLMAMSPEHGLRALLKVNQYNEALLKRIMVMCEHHRGAADHQHPYSRIIAAACAFDALTTDRPYRRAFRPDKAVRILWRMVDKRTDRTMTTILIQCLGLHPCGTLLQLSDGSMAVSLGPSADPGGWRTPVVRIIRDANGQTFMPAPIIDLGKPSDGICRVVERVLDADEHGVNTAAWLYGEDAPRNAVAS